EKAKIQLQPTSYSVPTSGSPPILQPKSPTSRNPFSASHPTGAATAAPSCAGREVLPRALPPPAPAGRAMNSRCMKSHLPDAKEPLQPVVVVTPNE
ncbi:unnamed protein product, partial [Urochloa humidicola]